MFITGGMLFVGYASQAYQNRFFRIKVAMLLMAAINAAVYHLVTERDRVQWDVEARLPPAARMAGVISLVAWATVIVCGRMMAYTMY